MPRGQRRKRRRRRQRDPMRRRMGLEGWNGSRPFSPWSKTLTTVTIGHGNNPGTIAGTIFNLPCNNWNDPIGPFTNPVSGSGFKIENRHPVNHEVAIAQGYNMAEVLSWKCRLKVNWILADTPTADFLVAYTFSGDTATEVSLTVASNVASIERAEILTNPRWTVKRMRGVQGVGESHTSKDDIIINVPNMYKYLEILGRGGDPVSWDHAAISHLLLDVNSGSNPPAIGLFCTVVVMTESGAAMAINSVAITVTITQKVKIMRDYIGAEDMDGGEVDLHA